MIQWRTPEGERRLAAVEQALDAYEMSGVSSTYELAMLALDEGRGLADAAIARRGAPVDLAAAEREGRLLAPIDHDDPTHVFLTGIYLIDRDGAPVRLGFALANEFSNHITERGNHLWLAHSKLRPASLGAELLTGTLPDDVRGTSRILRDGRTLWEKPFLSGEANMSHSIANLEHHHFKYGLFRRPGDVHVHFFGTATLSFAGGVTTQDGDVFEVEAGPFELPLLNPLGRAAATPVTVHSL